MKFVTILVVTLTCTICAIQSLDCGIDNTANQKDLRQIAENCMKKKDEKKKPISQDSDEEDEDEAQSSTTEATMKKRNKRNDDNSNSQNKRQYSNNNDENNKNSDSNNSTSNGKDNCVVQCIFGQMGLTDSDGLPVRHRLTDALLKNAKSRELRDFVQDTTDECFQLMDQGEHQDSCQYSVTLVNCLAERGKSNCADWPVGNLSFLTNKN